MTLESTNNSDLKTTFDDDNDANDNVFSWQASKQGLVSQQSSQQQSHVKIGSRIRSDVVEQFKSFVIKKHGKLRNGFQTELETALIEYNNSRRKQQQTASLTNYSGTMIRNDVILRLNQIKKAFQGIGSYPNFSPDSIKKILQQVLGEVDKRTYNKYLNMIRKDSKTRSTSFGYAVVDVTRFCESVPEEFSP